MNSDRIESGARRRLPVVPFVLVWACALLLAVSAKAQGQKNPKDSTSTKAQSLFDGKTLKGWEARLGERHLWRVSGGAISGGSLDKKVPRNSFLATKRSFHNFELRLKIRVSGKEGFINSGIQIRSLRVPGSHEMTGYQVDAGDGWWGKLYDESRRNRVIGQATDLAAVNRAIKSDGWNEYRIRAEGARIRSWINGVPALDYTEKDVHIALDGHIGVQVHGGGKALIQIKDVTIEELPPTPGAPTWKELGLPKSRSGKKAKAKTRPRRGKVQNQTSIRSPVRAPEEERAGFRVPDGFDVELVAAESAGIGKFVAVAFDTHGRMWTMTALEYPVDANENPEVSRRLFERGGRDRVLVYDDPFGPAPGTGRRPRVFVDDLVMPLGILPYRDGVFVQYGSDIRFYRDTDDDGRADTHEVVLTGFGTQDSHLFPHQFTRTPGGWILTAQGLFNSSVVRRPGGLAFADGTKEVIFNHTKLARFRMDGSVFEALTAGPNNIWGLTISRVGETWLQEANDLGFPIMPYEPGARYPTGSRERLRPYQPLMPPPLGPPQMGGTGLSGLVLADDRHGWPFPWGLRDAPPRSPRTFYVANPITSRVQVIRATFEDGRYRYQKLPDFLESDDPRFRPVALEFGPDGCLYVVDWYNKIISHNEVPRNHRDRDKTRGRIWRIRHRAQPSVKTVNLARLESGELLRHLGAPNACVSDLAWQEIVDRRATHLSADLDRIVRDSKLPTDRRLGALWALEGVGGVPVDALVQLARDRDASIRRESVRVAAAQGVSSECFLRVAAPLVDDSASRVRAALGDALRRVDDPSIEIVEIMARFGRASLDDGDSDPWTRYDREFERFLARWAMERNRIAVAAFLRSDASLGLPFENRVLATLALGGREAAIELARLVPKLGRRLGDEEIRVLAKQLAEPTVAAVVERALAEPASLRETLATLLRLRTELDTSGLRAAIVQAARALWSEDPSVSGRLFTLRVIGAFDIVELDETISSYASDAGTPIASRLAALRTLREIASEEVDTLVRLATSHESPGAMRELAVAALAASRSARAPAAVFELLPELLSVQRAKVLDELVATKAGAVALLEGIRSGTVEEEDVAVSLLERMSTLLAGHEEMEELWSEYTDLKRVLVLGGGARDCVSEPLVLRGPFTVECWVRLARDISHHDGILGAGGAIDINFHERRLRVWSGRTRGDLVVAETLTTPELWTHYAVTRDDSGGFRIFINGELDAESRERDPRVLPGLRVGWTCPTGGGTDGSLAEFRVWDSARTASQIRENFDRSFGEEQQPRGLVLCLEGTSWGQVQGEARVLPSRDLPRLLTEADAEQRRERFVKYRALARQPGREDIGKELFSSLCTPCHRRGDRGGQIGPPLDGIGHKDVDALLRNLLTPNAAIEGGYRKYRVLTRTGRLLEGLLVSEDGDAVVLRQPDRNDFRVPRADILRAGYTATSVMPEGLLEALEPQQVVDLFAYLRSLK